MVFEYSSARIELHELAPDADGFGGYAMCEKHAAAVSAPVGWTLTDARPATMALFPIDSLGADPAPAAGPVPDSDVA
jgi:hypothetical protein